MRRLSLRARIVLLVLVVALLPLVLVGWWLTRTASRSGEDLLVRRLDEGLQQAATDIGAHWSRRRSALLNIAQRPSVVELLRAQRPASASVAEELSQLAARLDPAVLGVTIHDAAGSVFWDYDRTTAPGDSGAIARDAVLTIPIELYEAAVGNRIGTLFARVRALSLFADGSNAAFAPGSAMTIVDPSTGASLIAVPFDPSAVNQPRFEWAGEEWVARRRSLAEPRLDLVTAAPLTPFTQPFEDAARRGLWLLFIAAAIALATVAVITRRMTRALSRLSLAAEKVAAGDLEARIDVVSNDEVGRLARAFNAMTASLKQTLEELSRREALVAVGEFASELAHEVRNPLTSIQVDLQLVEEQLPSGSQLRAIQAGALEDIKRLDATVGSVLRLARSGKVEARRLNVSDSLRAAVRGAQGHFEARRAALVARLPAEPIPIDGDSAALTQVFVNLLINAAQALPPGGSATVDTEVHEEELIVRVSDNGCGIAADTLARVREPFFSTKSEGTGLGLAVAERTVRAHRGHLHIESSPSVGTQIEVRLPLAESHREGA